MNPAPTDWGLLALTPLAVTLLLAFITRSALVSMLVGVFVGTLMAGSLPGVGMSELFQASLGNANFIWICEIVALIGILFEQFRRAGVLVALPLRLRLAAHSRRGSTLTAWGLGAIIIDDYFSPLMAGAISRPLTDSNRVSREKLAFLLDATTASVCILFPFAAWGAYMASLVLAQGGPVADVDTALKVFIASIPWNFYAVGILLFSLLVGLEWLPDFGPMARAERRARDTGQLLRPGARPLREVRDPEQPVEGVHLGMELGVPVLLILAIAAGGLVATGAVLIVEAFGAAVIWMFAISLVRRRLGSVADVAAVIEKGVQDVVPALLVVAAAYALNAIAAQLGAGTAIVSLFGGDSSPGLLLPLTFLVTAAIAFATGTSWGAFAIMMPVSLPAAYALGDGGVTPLALQTIGAIAGGGIFGDNASPVSDTTVLASVGAGCDHMDHVITQLPYAVAVALLVTLLYWIV
jgi:Na+/H+ antiporter NhaC